MPLSKLRSSRASNSLLQRLKLAQRGYLPQKGKRALHKLLWAAYRILQGVAEARLESGQHQHQVSKDLVDNEPEETRKR
jgi:hypothetical protein